MTDTHGLPVAQPSAYEAGKSWKLWLKHLEIYLKAKKINEAGDKALVLLQCLSERVMEHVMGACEPEEPESLSYDELVRILAKSYDKTVDKRVNRVALLRIEQQQSETYREYWCRLMDLAAKCAYDRSGKDEAMVLAFIRGVRSEEVRAMLLSPTNSEKNGEELLLIAEAWMESKMIAGESRIRESSQSDINMVKKHGKCFVCGGRNHAMNECRYRNLRCRKCQEIGHLERMCRVADGSGKKTKKMNQVRFDEEADSEEEYL